MVSPGKLRAVCELRDGEYNAFEPSIDETGTVSYPFARRHLDDRDGEPVTFLEELAERGILDSQFQHKVYVCPDCSAEGMQYSSGCPHCGSVHATQESTAVHTTCEQTLETDLHMDPDPAEENEETEDGEKQEYCPGCEEPLTPEDLESIRQYRCHDCESWFESPIHRLWCRECSRVYAPSDAREQPLYRYPLTPAGEEWAASQLEGRQSLAETIEKRGYETIVDTFVPTSTDEAWPVHVYAEDDLLDDRIVADVHGSPTVADVKRLLEASQEADARPVVLSTSGELEEHVAGMLEAEDVTIVSATDDGFTREYVVSEGAGGSARLLDRLGSLFSSSTGR